MHVLLHPVKAFRIRLALGECNDLRFHIVELVDYLCVSFIDRVCYILPNFQIERLCSIFWRNRWPSSIIKSFRFWSVTGENLEYSVQQDSVLVINLISMQGTS